MIKGFHPPFPGLRAAICATLWLTGCEGTKNEKSATQPDGVPGGGTIGSILAASGGDRDAARGSSPGVAYGPRVMQHRPSPSDRGPRLLAHAQETHDHARAFQDALHLEMRRIDRKVAQAPSGPTPGGTRKEGALLMALEQETRTEINRLNRVIRECQAATEGQPATASDLHAAIGRLEAAREALQGSATELAGLRRRAERAPDPRE